MFSCFCLFAQLALGKFCQSKPISSLFWNWLTRVSVRISLSTSSSPKIPSISPQDQEFFLWNVTMDSPLHSGYILKLWCLFNIHSISLKYWMLYTAFYKNLWILIEIGSYLIIFTLSLSLTLFSFLKTKSTVFYPEYKALCSFLSVELSGSAVLPTSPSLSGFVNCSWGAESFFLSILLPWYSGPK